MASGAEIVAPLYFGHIIDAAQPPQSPGTATLVTESAGLSGLELFMSTWISNH